MRTQVYSDQRDNAHERKEGAMTATLEQQLTADQPIPQNNQTTRRQSARQARPRDPRGGSPSRPRGAKSGAPPTPAPTGPGTRPAARAPGNAPPEAPAMSSAKDPSPQPTPSLTDPGVISGLNRQATVLENVFF